jgi:uncharacterized protein (UPF0332 family)
LSGSETTYPSALSTSSAFDGSQFLDDANELVHSVGDEASERSAISRAYYASFHWARNYSRRKGLTVSQSSSAHRDVRTLLGLASRGIGQDLRRLHMMRKQADYDIPFPAGNVTNQTNTALTLARQIMTAIDALP